MNRSEFDARVAALRPALLSMARRKLPPDDCEDAVQNAILAAWTHLPQLRDEAAFDGWVKRILARECSMMRRKRKNELPLDENLPAGIAQADGFGLPDALERLSREERELLLLHHEQGYTLGELSQMTGKPEDALKMKLYRSRRKLRLLLISLLLFLLLAAAAIGSGLLNVNWFLQNRTASNPPLYNANQQSVCSISYSGRFLSAEVNDAIWDEQTLSLLFTCLLTGTQPLTVHAGNIGVDGERFDCIWVDGEILPVEEWAQGQTVYVYTLEGWQLDGYYPTGSEDSLPVGLGESFFARLRMDGLLPERYEALLDADGMLTLTCGVTVREFSTNELLETGLLTLRVAAPDADTWRECYEAYYRESVTADCPALPRRAGANRSA